MRSGSLLMIVMSLLIGVTAVYFGNAWIEKRSALLQSANEEMVDVVAAATDIEAGVGIKRTNLTVIKLPKRFAPDGDFDDPAALVGKIARQPVYAGEILLNRRVLDDVKGNMLAEMLAPGKRAITVRVDDVSGVAGFLLPGSWADVIAVSDGRARTLLTRLKILAVDQKLRAEGKDALQVRAVTLEVTPKQAEILTEAGGSIRLVLRNPRDNFRVALNDGETKEPVPAGNAGTPPAATVVREVRTPVSDARVETEPAAAELQDRVVDTDGQPLPVSTAAGSGEIDSIELIRQTEVSEVSFAEK